MTIVIAWKSTRVNGVKGLADTYAAAAVWLNEGTEKDIAEADSYARSEACRNDGTFQHRIFAYQNENDPLARARAEILNLA